MPLYDFTFKNTGSAATVNSGNGIWLHGSSYTVARKFLNKSNPNNAGTLPEANQGGREATKISITGYIDTRNTSGTYTINGLSNCSKASEYLINELANLTQSAVSKINFIAAYKDRTGGAIIMRNFANTTTGMNIVIDSMNLNVSTDSRDGHIWGVSLDLTETQ
jgi:hypothetical protein